MLTSVMTPKLTLEADLGQLRQAAIEGEAPEMVQDFSDMINSLERVDRIGRRMEVVYGTPHNPGKYAIGFYFVMSMSNSFNVSSENKSIKNGAVLLSGLFSRFEDGINGSGLREMGPSATLVTRLYFENGVVRMTATMETHVKAEAAPAQAEVAI